MTYENKFFRLLAKVKSRKQMDALLDYFKENNIQLREEQVRTALNKYYMLPEEEDDSSNSSS